jgi:hypothetical protein
MKYIPKQHPLISPVAFTALSVKEAKYKVIPVAPSILRPSIFHANQQSNRRNQ